VSRDRAEIVEWIERRLSSIETEAVRIRAIAELVADTKLQAAIVECCSAIWADLIAVEEHLKQLG